MTGIGTIMAAMQRQMAAMDELVAMLKQPEQANGAAVVDRVGRIISSLAVPIERGDDEEELEESDRQMALLIAFERHGEGLSRYDPQQPCAAGDVVIGDKRTMWLVEAVDEEGKAARLIGAGPAKDEEPRLRWRPTSEARLWLDERQQVQSPLKDPERVLSRLAGLWGRTTIGSRSLDRPAALAGELLRGQPVSAAGLGPKSDAEAVGTWLKERGAAEPGEGDAAMPGDLLWLPAVGAAVILRATEGTYDALLPGDGTKGAIGEPARAARIVHGHAPAAGALVWRPHEL